MIWMYLLYALVWIIYLAVLMWVILFKGTWDNTYAFIDMIRNGQMPERQKVYLVPFETTALFIDNWEYAYARWNVFGNILLFIPFGVLLYILLKRLGGVWIALGLSLLVSFAFEFLQYLYAVGEFDVDDIMLNVLGGVVGYMAAGVSAKIYLSITRYFRNSADKKFR